MTVQRSQRFTRDNPCPVCRGYEQTGRGQGKRCHGFRSEDGNFAHCTREEWNADALSFNSETGAWVHDLRRAPATERGGYATRYGEHLRVPPAAPPRGNPMLYDYRDASGALLFQVVRYPDKRFTQQRPDGKGGVIHNLDGVPRVLYRLPELLASTPETPVYIVEGEKDVNTLRALGLVATTNPGGAGKWRQDYNDDLRGRQVVIVPDNDAPGWNHAFAVAAALAPVAACVKVVTLPAVAEKGDVTDWLNAGGSLPALIALVAATQCWERPTDADMPFPISSLGESEQTRNHFVFATVDDLLREPEEEVAYVWEQTLPRGGISICAAKPKVGKSTLVRSLLHAVSRGEPFFGRVTQPGSILYLCLEEKRAEVRRQLRALGMCGTQVHIHTGSAPLDPLEALTEAIADIRPILTVIDPLAWFIRVAELNSYGEVMRAMEPLNTLARSSHCHILCVHHLGKGERGGGDALLGSTALFGAVDTLILMKRREQVRTVETIQRYGEDLPATMARLDPITYRVTAGESVLALQLEEAKAHILDEIGDDALREVDIKERVTLDTVAVQRAIKALTAEGRLSREGAGKRGDPFRYTRPSE